jgi:hypothetical protein
MTDTTVTDPTAAQGPFRMPDQGAVDSWRNSAPSSPLAPQSPLSAMGPPPVAPKPPEYPPLNMPPMPQQPTQQQLGPAPDAKDFQKNSMAFASAMAVLGAVASKFTRAGGTAALSAFSGALNGWKQGNLQAYEEASKKWEQDTKATIENNKQILEQYKLALENRKTNIDDQMSQIQLIATKYHDKIMYDAAASKNYTLVANIYEKNWEYTNGEKGIEATSAPLMAARKKEEEQQALTGERVASGQINPDGIDPKTGQPYSEKDKLYLKYTKERYLAGFYGSPTGKKGDGSNVPPQTDAYRTWLAGEQAKGHEPTGEEKQAFILSGHPPRSAAGMSLQQFITQTQQETGQKPTWQQINKFQADQAGNVAYQRGAAGQAARVENATNEVEQLLPQAIETSHAYLRGQVVPFNKIRNALESGVSDPSLNDFEMANFSLINAYTRAMNPQGVPHVQDRLEQHALNILSTANSPQAYDIQARRLWKEVQASKTAVAKTQEGRTGGDINSPVPGLDDATPAAPAAADGWGKAKVVGQ